MEKKKYKCLICKKEFENNRLLIRHLVKEHNFKLEQLYEYFNIDLTEENQICMSCGKPFKLNKRQLNDFKKGQIRTIGCSKSCIAYIRTTIKSPLSDKESHEKAKQTIFKRYGVDNLSDIPGVKEKRKQTCLEHFGVKVPLQSEEIKNKSKQTCLERYGVETVLSSQEIREKAHKTNLERYGDKNVWGKNSIIRTNVEQTNLERYGVKTPLQSNVVREKIHKTCLERYGVENVFASEEIKQIIENTNLKKYNAKSVLSKDSSLRKSIEDKIKESTFKHYGVSCNLQAKEVREIIKQTCLENYGVEYACQLPQCIESGSKRISKTNKDFYDKLKANNIDVEIEYIIGNFGFDLRVENILIEINPTYTHNSTFGAIFAKGFQTKPKSVDYHLHKSKLAKDNGFHCVHIFDWDNQDLIINMLKPQQSIYARKCDIKQIDKKLAKQFLNQYHLQGCTQTCQYAYGLFYNDELFQVITFGKPRYNKKYDYELLRLCTKSGFKIIGGASKLLTHFERDVKPKSLISYCDLSKFNGDIYEKLGFKYIRTSIMKHWYNIKTNVHITDNLLRQRGFDQLHGTNYGKGTSNEELMLEHDYVEVYDAGQSTYIKTYEKGYLDG